VVPLQNLLICAAVSVTALSITNSRNRTLLTIAPTGYPANRYIARRDIGDDSPVEYIQVGAHVAPTRSGRLILTSANRTQRADLVHPLPSSSAYPMTMI
jgi:hypothetical protein